MFSKACEYAIKSVIFIAQEALVGRKTNVKQISEATNAPESFVAKILQPLSKKGILLSNKGKQGGFSIDLDKLEEIKLIEIVLITDGPDILTRCAFGLEKCSSEKPCPFHFKYKPIREGLKASLSEISIYDMALKTEQGEAFLKL
jgi:Rrf2 family protein